MIRTELLGIIAAGTLLLAGTPAMAATDQAVPLFDGFSRTSQYIRSSDGTRLAIDIYRPTLHGQVVTEKVPVIFAQDRSGRRQRPRDLELWTSHGYALVAQDRRGTGASFGSQVGFVNRADARDGAAVVEWAGTQSWSTGKVGAIGCSNQGLHQYAVAAEKPNHLVAIAPECASPFLWDTMISPNGASAFAFGSQPAYAGECGPARTDSAPVDEDKDGSLAKAAAEEQRCNAKMLGQYWANMHRDSVHPFLNYQPALVDPPAERWADIKASGVKILTMAAWFEANPGPMLQGWQLWGGVAVSGPWTHGYGVAANGFPNVAEEREALKLRFFDETLKGRDTGLFRQPPIRYYTMHAPVGTEWRSAESWPLPAQQLTRYYFAQGASGTVKSLNDGLLTRTMPSGRGASDTYRPDYSAALFDGKYSAMNRYFAGDSRPGLDEKAVTYTLAALQSDLQVTGHPIADLWVTSTARDDDFYAVLEDVAPDGISTYVTHGAIRASRRALTTPPYGNLGTPWHPQREADDQPLSASKPMLLRFDLMATSWNFRAGHRLRITIANSAGPMFQQPDGVDKAATPQITIWRDAANPSSVVLPVIPAASLTAKAKASSAMAF